MTRSQHSSFLTNARQVLALGALALGVLTGCGQNADSPAAQARQQNPSDGPALDRLARFGTSLASRSSELNLEFRHARNGVSTANADADDSFSWSVFYLSFTTPEPSELQLSGNLHSQTLSPENQMRQDRWQLHVCTAELKEVMQQHNIDVVYATFGKADMPVAQCQKMEK